MIDNQRFDISLSIGHFPKIIDFGLSVTNDLVFVINALQKRSIERKETFPLIEGLDQLYEETSNGEYDPIASFLLENKLFEKIRSTSKRLKLVRERLCFFCGSRASVQWSNNDERVFCGHSCALKLNKIAQFI